MGEKPRRARRGRRLMRALLVLAVVAALASGVFRTATGPASGVFSSEQNRTTQRAVIRVATYNIHSGIGADGRRDLDRTASALKGFDLVGLNEVRGALLGDDEAAILGKRLGMSWIFSPTERHWWYDDFGNAALLN